MDDFQNRSGHIAHTYSQIAGEYAANFYGELAGKPFDRDLLTRFSALTRNGPVCDMGCGPGHVAAFLKKCGSAVFGMDISEEMIAEAKRLAPDVTFKQGDMFHPQLEDNSLSGIASFYSIVNYRLNDVDQAFSAFYKALVHGGFLLLAFHAGRNRLIKVRRFFSKRLKLDFCFFNPDDMIKKLKACGFSIEETTVRHPYNDEYPTKRAYILAKK